MKRLFTLMMLLGGGLVLSAQPLQYFIQRSSTNIAAVSEVSSLQAFLSGSQSFQGFEGAPRDVLLNVASPLPEFGNRNRNTGRAVHSTGEPTRNFVSATIHNKTFGVHSLFKATAGYNYRMFVSDITSITFGLGGGISSTSRNYSRWEPEAMAHDVKETKFLMQVGVRYEMDRLGVSAFMNGNDFSGEISWGRLWDGGGGEMNDNWGDWKEKEKNWHGQIAVMARHNTELGTNSLRILAQAVYRDGLGVGVSYQTGNDISANVSLRFTRYLRIGYAYQLMAMNPLAKQHEIVVRYRFVKIDEN